MTTPAAKFDAARAEAYGVESRIALAGYEACHELAACLLSAVLADTPEATILVAGAGGTGQEILAAGRLEPHWRFVAVDPSPPMLAGARAAVEAAGLAARVDFRLGEVSELPAGATFAAATLIGVLHHLPGEAAKRALLAGIAERLPAGAPFILAGNRGVYRARPQFLAAWRARWRMAGVAAAEIEARHARIMAAAEPPASDEAIAALLDGAGFTEPTLFFSSLFWGAWIARRR